MIVVLTRRDKCDTIHLNTLGGLCPSGVDGRR